MQTDCQWSIYRRSGCGEILGSIVNPSGRFATKHVSIEAKLIALYCCALLGASLAEIEVCQAGLWGCRPLRGAWIVRIGATPMLAIFAFTPMSRRLLVIVSATIGITLFLAGVKSGNSAGSLTWAGHNFFLLLFGTSIAMTIMTFSALRHDRPILPPPPSTPPFSDNSNRNLRLFSLKNKLLYLYAGALAGGILGQILIYGSVNDRSSFEYDKISLDDMLFLLVRIIGGSATPIIILLSQLTMDRATTIRCSIVVAILVLGLSVVYGQYDSLFGHDALGYNCLWFASILAAFAALTVQKRRLSSRA